MALIRAHIKPKEIDEHWILQLVVLLTIWEGGPISASKIAKRCGIPRPTCIRIADTLMRRRMVRKDQDSCYIAHERHLTKLEGTSFFSDSRKLIKHAAKKLERVTPSTPRSARSARASPPPVEAFA